MRSKTVLIIFIVLLFGISACGQAAQKGTPEISAPAESFNKTGYPIVNEPITVTCIVTYACPAGTENNPRLAWQIAEETTNIHVDFTHLDSAQLPVVIAAGDWPDFFHEDLAATYVNEYGIQGGRFVDYNTLLDYMPNMVQLFNDHPETRKGKTEMNGAMYQLPYYEVVPTLASSRMYYRTDTLKNLNLDVPTSTNELYDVLKTIFELTNEAPFCGDYYRDYMYASFGPGIQLGYDDEKNDGVVSWGRETEQYKYYLTYMNKLYSEGLLHQEYVTQDSTARSALMEEGKIVFGGGVFEFCTINAFPSGTWDLDVLTPLTSEYDNERVILSGPRPFQARGKAINASSKYIYELARLFDTAFAMEEVVPGSGLYGITYAWGPENLTWEFTNPEKTTHKLIIPPEYDVPSFAIFQRGHLTYDNFGRHEAMANTIVNDGSNGEARQKGFRDNNMPYARPWVFPPVKFTVDEQSTLDNYIVELNTYVGEMHDKFITGISNINTEWDSYINTLNRMGSADVLEIYQTAYERWNEM